MPAEFRLIITATFGAAAERDAAAIALRNQVLQYNTNNPGKIKQAHLTRDDYYVSEQNGQTEALV